MSQAGAVRKILQEGPVNIKTIAERLDIPRADRKGRLSLRDTLRDLLEVGVVELLPGETPQYRLTGRSGPKDTQAKMARAVRLKGLQNRTITCKDLVALSGCSQEYAKRYLRWLKNADYLLQGEAVKLSRFGLGLAYRVAPGREKEAPPHWSRREEKNKSASTDACAECRERIGGILGKMRQTLTAISGDAELMMGMVNDLESGLPGMGRQS